MKKIVILFLSLFFCSTVFAAGPYTEFVVLGDSLSDNGNLFKTPLHIPKSPPYFKGRFTNGHTWAENLGIALYNKYGIDYDIYAVGGATAIIHSPAHDKFPAPTNLDIEYVKYSSENVLRNKSQILFGIWIGANDYLYEEDPNMNRVTTNVVNKISSITNLLITQGAKNFLIMNLPDLARTPYSNAEGSQERMHNVTLMHNTKLLEAVNKLKQQNPNVKFVFVDVYEIFNDLLQNPEKFNKLYNVNITNLNEACWKGGMALKNSSLSPDLAVAEAVGQSYGKDEKPCDNADEHVFWDEIHPTSTIHAILGKIIEPLV